MKHTSKKQHLFSVTKSDCTFKYYKGSGPGGQKRNKTENCCQCTHKASGAQGSSEDGKSKEQNQKQAFKRMTETTKFKLWMNKEILRITGELEKIEEKVSYELENHVKIEGKDEKGNWHEI